MARPKKDQSANSPKKTQSPIKKERAAKNKKDPNVPKRAQSAYLLWLSEVRPRLAKKGGSPTEVLKLAGAEWATVKDRTKWEKLAALDKERYAKEMESYNAKGTAGASPEKEDENPSPVKETKKAKAKK